MNFIIILILISSLSFIFYGFAYFISPQMKSEFNRFGLEKAGALTAILELLGAFGLLAGLKFPLLLLISAGGLAILMFLGVIIRVKIKDSFWLSLPALFFMILNSYIFFYVATTNKISSYNNYIF
jgi:type II secretory pathway component PulF